ncbi:hypothetical protein NPIL_489011 [Nephila pilipes]|uniref:Uncharacterized protein n=1 Tax=Nephila pilipes TaxID=299642 RepID=A0A8X6T5R5_NEPPI|nr:hypothetical protein NPIL_489011 [Nephila pilipes]
MSNLLGRYLLNLNGCRPVSRDRSFIKLIDLRFRNFIKIIEIALGMEKRLINSPSDIFLSTGPPQQWCSRCLKIMDPDLQ